MFQMNSRAAVVFSFATLICLPFSSDAQTYRGQRAGRTVSPQGNLSTCNYSGSTISAEQGLLAGEHQLFSDIDGGKCVLNGARFIYLDEEGAQAYELDMEVAPLPVLDLEGMDLSQSSWVAVDLGGWVPVFRDAWADLADFSALFSSWDLKNRVPVDATGFGLTNARIHGSDLENWYVQGGDFSGSDFTSVAISGWKSDSYSYKTLVEDPEGFTQWKGEDDPDALAWFMTHLSEEGLREADEDNQRFHAVRTKFYNCEFSNDCVFSGADFQGCSMILTKVGVAAKSTQASSKKSFGGFGGSSAQSSSPKLQGEQFNGCNFKDGFFMQSKFLNVDFSGSDFEKARMDECEFDGCKLTGANFQETTIRNCEFAESCVLHGASFEGATLEGVNFNGLDLSNCDFTGMVSKRLKGREPLLPEDYTIGGRDTTWITVNKQVVVEGETTEVPDTVGFERFYSIVVSERRYGDGLRETKN